MIFLNAQHRVHASMSFIFFLRDGRESVNKPTTFLVAVIPVPFERVDEFDKSRAGIMPRSIRLSLQSSQAVSSEC